MATIKTEKQRRQSREASRRRRRRQNRRATVVLFVLLLIVMALIWWWIGRKNAADTPDAPVTDPTAGTTAPTVATLPTTAPTEPSRTYVDGHYVQPAGAPWNLLLVNDWNEMPESYVDTIPLADFNASWAFDSRALDALNAMIDAANAAGCDMWGQSLYRPYDMQYRLYWAEVDVWLANGYEQAEAEAKAATIVKRPGQSEHNTGLALDFECREFPYLDEGFKNTKAYEWLIAHCAEYGFILRFPEGKEDITGVIYEPWHYRYVGAEHATEIMARGLTLEEYLEEKGW